MKIPIELERIGLGLPGGGFRSAGFSLGVLSMLNKVGLLECVKGISTVSGGTITGMLYAKSVIDGKSFDEFKTKTLSFLTENSLLTKALSDIKDKSKFKGRNQNLINAFALQYCHLVNGTFSDITDNLPKTHLEEVIFNATDFANQLPFRFRYSTESTTTFGNKSNNFNLDEIKSIRLGDIIAASSCFPGGFEPILFPTDFMTKRNIPNERHVPLMDGGILDNQGITSFLTSENPKYGTYLIADASTGKQGVYNSNENNKIAKIISVLLSLPITFLAIILAIGVYSFLPKFYNLFTLPLATFFIVVQLFVLFVKNNAIRYLGIEGKLVLPRKKLGVYIIDRITSLLTMSSSIFLKGNKGNHVKYLFFEMKSHARILTLHILSQHVDSSDNFENKGLLLGIFDDVSPISSKVLKACRSSANFKTTLWFTEGELKKNLPDDLVLCGEATCAVALLKHLYNANEKGSPLYNKVLEYWKALQ